MLDVGLLPTRILRVGRVGPKLRSCGKPSTGHFIPSIIERTSAVQATILAKRPPVVPHCWRMSRTLPLPWDARGPLSTDDHPVNAARSKLPKPGDNLKGHLPQQYLW